MSTPESTPDPASSTLPTLTPSPFPNLFPKICRVLCLDNDNLCAQATLYQFVHLEALHVAEVLKVLSFFHQMFIAEKALKEHAKTVFYHTTRPPGLACFFHAGTSWRLAQNTTLLSRYQFNDFPVFPQHVDSRRACEKERKTFSIILHDHLRLCESSGSDNHEDSVQHTLATKLFSAGLLL